MIDSVSLLVIGLLRLSFCDSVLVGLCFEEFVQFVVGCPVCV